MKIWTITTDGEDGTATAVHVTKEAALAQYARITHATWERWVGDGGRKCPDDLAEAWDFLTSQVGFMDVCVMTEHSLQSHPAVREAIAALQVAKDRLEVNDDDGDEMPFWEDCETAQAMLEGRPVLVGEG